MAGNKIVIGLIDMGIHPDLPYLSNYTIRLKKMDEEGRLSDTAKVSKGDLHGSKVISVICGPYYDDESIPVPEIEAITIPRLGKTILHLLRALDAMLQSDIHILCLPVGIYLPTPVFRPFIKAFLEKGILIVVPSGNKGKKPLPVPGSYPEVLTVGALEPSGQVASFSGRLFNEAQGGYQKPNIFARGEFPNPSRINQNNTILGTSYACAHVAGRAARIWSQFPNADVAEIMTKLEVPSKKENGLSRVLTNSYLTKRLKTALRLSRSEDLIEAIIISGIATKNGRKDFPINKLLGKSEQISGCSPAEVNYFSVKDVVHLRAKAPFFQSLLTQKAMYCAQSVDVNMFDML